MRLERWIYTLPLRLRSLFRRPEVDRELDEELRYHVEERAEQHVANGLGRTEARRRAILDLEGIERSKEECREARKVNCQALLWCIGQEMDPAHHKTVLGNGFVRVLSADSIRFE